MTINLIPDVSNWIFYSLVVMVVVSGFVAVAVAFSAMFRGVMR